MRKNTIINHTFEIVNADTPGEICVVIPGQWEGHPAGDYSITEQDIEEMVANFNVEKREILFDYDHNSLWGSSKSAGWGQSLEVRDGKIYAKVEWTPEGKKAVENKEYKYLSNVLIFNYYDPNNKELVGSYLHSVALTNVPFQKDLPKIMNKMFPKNKNEGEEMKEILKALGVKTEEEALQEIINSQKLLKTSKDNALLITELKGENSKLTDKLAELNENVVNNEIDLAISKGELLPKNRKTAILLRNTDMEAYTEFIKNTEKVPGNLNIPNNDEGNPEDAEEKKYANMFIPGGEK